MEAEIRRLRAAAQRLVQGRPRSQIRYPDRFRRAAVTVARLRQGQGASVARVARELGVSEPTLTKWLRPPARPLVRPVVVTPAPIPPRPAAANPVLITATGVRVEGLNRDGLVAVLRALG